MLLSPGGRFVERGEEWESWLSRGLDGETLARLRLSTKTGRRCGDGILVRFFEEKLSRLLRPQKPGPKRHGTGDLTRDRFS